MDFESEYKEPKPRKPAWWPSICAGILFIILLSI